MKAPEPTREHLWLASFAGEWRVESTYSMGPDQPQAGSTGRETARRVGELWIVAEGHGDDPEHGSHVFTFGYDPAKKKFVGTFITSMMPMLWLYEGELDASGRVLELGAEGPSMSGDGSFVRYIDAFELVNDDERVLSSRMRNPDGSWTAFMRSVYRRVR